MTKLEEVARAIFEAEPFTVSQREPYWQRHKHHYVAQAAAADAALTEERTGE